MQLIETKMQKIADVKYASAVYNGTRKHTFPERQ
jgi:hypothetical protein